MTVDLNTMNPSLAQSNWQQALSTVIQTHNPVVFERQGHPIAALISTEDFERLQSIEAAEDADDEAFLQEFQRQRTEGQVETLDFEQIRSTYASSTFPRK